MDDAPAPIPAPAGFVRAGVDPFDAVAVPLASGVVVLVRPARTSASDYLAGKASPYAVAALRARDALLKAHKLGTATPHGTVADVVVEAIQDAYDVPPDVVELWFSRATSDDLMAVASAAIGATPTDAARERCRSAALVAGGLGTVPLSPMDAAALADWTGNAGRAPRWG